MSVSDCCENCDYSPVSFASKNKCPVYDKGLRDKKQIPLGKKCEFYYNLNEVVSSIIDEKLVIKEDDI